MSEKFEHHHAQLATPQWKSKKNQMIHYDLELFVNERELSLIFLPSVSHTFPPSISFPPLSFCVCEGNDIEFNLDFFFSFFLFVLPQSQLFINALMRFLFPFRFFFSPTSL